MYDQLRRDVVRGVGWAFFSSVSVRMFQIATTLVLAKLLMPSDFGVFAIASMVTNAMIIFFDLGFAQALIYRQGDIRRSANTAFILSTVTSGILAILLFFVAPLLGRIFSAPAVTLPIRVMSPCLVIFGITAVPLALLDRELRFKRRAMLEVAGVFSYTVVSISLAVAGFKVWSMVIGWVAMTVVGAAVAWLVSSWRPNREFCLQESRVIVNYGKHLVAASLASFIFLQIDKAAVGKWFGMTMLGFYSIAFTICNMPATNLTAVVNRVMFPTYSKLHDDLLEIRRVYLQSIKHLSMATFPIVAGIIVLAGPAIRVFYGSKWSPAIPLFDVLALYGMIRAIGATTEAVLMAVGRPWLVRRVSSIQLFVGGLLVYPAAKILGAMGVAWLFTVAYLAGTLYGLAKVQQILDIGILGWARAVKTPVAAALVAGIFGRLTSAGLGRPTWITVALTGMVLGGGYALYMFVLDRSVYGELVALAKSRKVNKQDVVG